MSNNNRRSANSKQKEETTQNKPIKISKSSQNNDDLDDDNTTQITQTPKTSSKTSTTKTQTNASKKNQQTQNKNTDKNTDKITNTKTNNKQEEKQPKPKRVIPTSTHFIGIFGGGILKNTDYIIVKDDNMYGIDEYYRKLKNIYEFNDSIKKFNGKVFYVLDSEDVYDKFITHCDNTENCEEKEKIRYKDVSDFNDNILNHIHLIHATSISYIVNKIREICNNVCKPYPEVIRSVKPRQSKKPNDVAPKQASAQKQDVQETDNSDNPILTANIQKSNNPKKNRKQVVIVSDDEENNDEENNDSDEASELVDNNDDDNINEDDNEENEENEDNNEEEDDN